MNVSIGRKLRSVLFTEGFVVLAMVAAVFAFVRHYPLYSPYIRLIVIRYRSQNMSTYPYHNTRRYHVTLRCSSLPSEHALRVARGTFTDGFAGYSSCSWPSMRYDYEMSSNSSAFSVCREKSTRSHLIRIIASLTGFHLALVVFAAIQIHETRAALVRPNPTSWIVSSLVGLPCHMC